MNIITLVGRLTRDPNYNEVQNEKGTQHIANFYLAVQRNYGQDVNYIKVTAFGNQADFAKEYLKKGKRVAVAGELITGSYQDAKTGQIVRTAEVNANRIEFADSRDDDTRLRTDLMAKDFANFPEELEKELPFR